MYAQYQVTVQWVIPILHDIYYIATNIEFAAGFVCSKWDQAKWIQSFYLQFSWQNS